MNQFFDIRHGLKYDDVQKIRATVIEIKINNLKHLKFRFPKTDS